MFLRKRKTLLLLVSLSENNRISINYSRDELFANLDSPLPSPAGVFYAENMGRLFTPIGTIDPDTPLTKRTDSASASFYFHRAKYLGLTASTSLSLVEAGLEKETKKQTDSGSYLLYLRAPWSLDGEGKYQIIPSVRRVFSHRAGSVEEPPELLDTLARPVPVQGKAWLNGRKLKL